jgi:hypothetical protein
MGCEYPCEGTADRSGLIPSAGPAVRRHGQTALMEAASNDDHAIVAALLGARRRREHQRKGRVRLCRRRCPARGRRWPTVTPMQPCPPRPAGGQRCTVRRTTAAPASSRTPRVHSRGAACRVLRRTPTHPRHDLRVALRAICRCHRTVEGRADTYRISVHSAGRRNASRAHGHVSRDALRVWLRVRSVVSRAWCFRQSSSLRRRPRYVRFVRPLAPVLESTIRPLWPKYSSHACVHSAHSAQIRLSVRRRRRRVEKSSFFGGGLLRTNACGSNVACARDTSHAACCMLPVVWSYLECNPVAPVVFEYRRLASLGPQPRSPQ